MLVRDHMSSPAVTIRTDTDYQSALKLMQEHAMHHLPVVDGGGRLVGITAERDLLLGAAHYLSSAVEVGEVMHRGAITVTPDMRIIEAADLMARNAIGALPVVNPAGQLLGIITESDLLRVLVAALRGVHRE